MKNKSSFLRNHSRLCLFVVIIFIAAIGCNGSTNTLESPEAPNEEISPPPEPDSPANANEEAREADEEPTEAPTEEPTEEPTEVPRDTAVPTAATGTIRGTVELSGYSTEPLVDTVVEIYNSQNYYQATTNEKGEYTILDVLPGMYVVNVLTNEGITNYQTVNVVAGEETVADALVYKAFPTPT